MLKHPMNLGRRRRERELGHGMLRKSNFVIEFAPMNSVIIFGYHHVMVSNITTASRMDVFAVAGRRARREHLALRMPRA